MLHTRCRVADKDNLVKKVVVGLGHRAQGPELLPSVVEEEVARVERRAHVSYAPQGNLLIQP